MYPSTVLFHAPLVSSGEGLYCLDLNLSMVFIPTGGKLGEMNIQWKNFKEMKDTFYFPVISVSEYPLYHKLQ